MILALIALVAVAWAIVEIISWIVAFWLIVFCSPERMGRKYPDTIDPTTGQQRILMDLTEPAENFSASGFGRWHPRRRGINRARRWAMRGKHLP